MSKRDQIVQSALKLFVDQGLQATPMSQVAKEAKTGMGTIYNQFASKEELVNAIYLSVKVKEATYLFQGYAEDLPVRERFEFLFGRLSRYFLANPLDFQFMDRFALSPIITDVSREEGKKHFGPINTLFEEGQKQRIIKNMPIQQLAYFVMAASSSLMRLNLSDPSAINDRTIDEHLLLAWDAIKN